MRSPKSSYFGFTLVELLVVIIVVAVLAAIAIPKLSGSSLRSREALLRKNLAIIRKAADRAEADTGLTFDVTRLTQASPPPSGWRRGQMGTNWTLTPVVPSRWRGPYLDRVPINPITGNNLYITGQPVSAAAWTHSSRQDFNSSYIFFPSSARASDGTNYNTW